MADNTGKYIQRLRSEKHMTVSDLASGLQYPENEIEALESGQILPDAELQWRLGCLFGVSADEFRIRSELDRLQTESNYLPVYSERSLTEYLDSLPESKRAGDLPFTLMDLYNKPKLPFRHLDPSIKADLLFRMPNKYLAAEDIRKNDLLVIRLRDFDPLKETHGFYGLVRLDGRLQIRFIDTFRHAGKPLFLVLNTSQPDSEAVLLEEKERNAILGRVVCVIRTE